MKNAGTEHSRRGEELSQAMKEDDLDTMFRYGHPWLRQL